MPRRDAGVPSIGETTVGFMPAHLAWKTYGPFTLAKGDNRVRIATDGEVVALDGKLGGSEDLKARVSELESQRSDLADRLEKVLS